MYCSVAGRRLSNEWIGDFVLREKMKFLFDRYQVLLSRRLARGGWIRCLIWGLVKAILEGVAFFYGITNVWMRASIGLIWVGIVAAAIILFITTKRSLELLDKEKHLRVFLLLQIIALILLAIQLPLLVFAAFFSDGLVTIGSTFLFVISGYAVSARLQHKD